MFDYTTVKNVIGSDVALSQTMIDAINEWKKMQNGAADWINEDVKSLRGKDAALVLMGHGQSHGRADLTFEGTRAVFHDADKRVFMATVEGARSVDDLLVELKAAKVKKVVIEPLMLVAGDHAYNDMAGDEDDSWASKLKAAGFKVETNLKGLGQVAGARAILVRHAREAADDLTKEPKKQ